MMIYALLPLNGKIECLAKLLPTILETWCGTGILKLLFWAVLLGGKIRNIYIPVWEQCKFIWKV